MIGIEERPGPKVSSARWLLLVISGFDGTRSMLTPLSNPVQSKRSSDDECIRNRANWRPGQTHLRWLLGNVQAYERVVACTHHFG